MATNKSRLTGHLQSDIRKIRVLTGLGSGGAGEGYIYPVINVKDATYGAIGDGVTDDSTAIQAALDALATAGGGKIFFPVGTYYIASTTLTYQSKIGILIFEGSTKYVGSEIIGNGASIMLDLIASDRGVIRNIRFNTSGACDVGILLARKDGSTASSSWSFESMSVVGEFDKACIYSINSEVNTFFNCEIRSTSNVSGSHAIYTSTENDKGVTSTGGTISDTADGATNSVINIIGGGVMHYGTNGIALGVYGGTRALTCHGAFFYSDGIDCILLDESSAVTTMNGPINIQNCSFEGASGVKAIHLGDVILNGLNIHGNLISITGAANYSEIYQDTVTAGRGLSIARIWGNRHTAASPMSFDRIFYSTVDLTGAGVEVRTLATAVEWKNATTMTYSAGAQDLSAIRTGRIASTERRIVLGPPATTANSDTSTYSTLQLRPSFTDKSPGATDIGMVTPWKGQYSSNPFGQSFYNKDSQMRHPVLYWTGYEYQTISLPRQEHMRSAAPATGNWTKGDVVWNSDPTTNSVMGWVCTVNGTPGTWNEFGIVDSGGTSEFTVEGEFTYPSTYPFMVKGDGANETAPCVQMIIRNTSEHTVVSEDYRNEVHLRLQAGSTSNHRAYINWADYTGTDKWLMGRTSLNGFILYDTSTVHRIWMEDDGTSYFNSGGTKSFIVNYHATDSVGTGGFTVHTGGAPANNIQIFHVSQASGADSTTTINLNAGKTATQDIFMYWKDINVNKYFLRKHATTNDFSLYDYGSATYALYWDTSAARLAVGHISPAARLDVNDTNSALTNTVKNVLAIGHDTSGTPAAGFGTGITVLAESATVARRNLGRLTYSWVTATDASRAARGRLTAYYLTTEQEAIRWDADTGGVKLGFYTTAAVAQHSATGETAGFTAGSGTSVNDDSTFTGNVGSTAYRISDIVKALKNVGLIAS